MILKILGILILSILGLAACIGLLVIFCPVRYRLAGSFFGKPEGSVRISWFFRLVSVLFTYKENHAELKICILGIRIRKRKKKKNFKTEKTGKNRKKREKKKLVKNPSDSPLTAENRSETESGQLEEQITDDTSDKVKKEVTQEIEKKVFEQSGKSDILSDKKEEQKKTGKIRLAEEKIKNILSSIKAGFQKFLELFYNLKQKKQAIVVFIKEEKNKVAFRYTRKRLFQLLHHVLPGKIKLKLHYGAKDPSVTGMVTGMLFMFYPKSAEKFEFTPDFEKQVLEGEIDIKGKVQIFRILWTIFLIYHHKECNRIIKMILKRLKAVAAETVAEMEEKNGRK